MGVSPSEVLRITFLCTGNRARSPLAEALFRRRVEGLPVEVSSCGTLSVGAKPALDDAVNTAASLGVDLKRHRSRTLERGGLQDVDLVVGFEPAHVSAAIDDGGAGADRTFMLLELPALLGDLATPDARSEVDRARHAIDEMNRRRESKPQAYVPALADPFGESRQVFAETTRVIDAMTGLLASKLFPY